MMVFAVFLSCVLANAWNLQRFLRRVNQWERFVRVRSKAMQVLVSYTLLTGAAVNSKANGCKALAIVRGTLRRN